MLCTVAHTQERRFDPDEMEAYAEQRDFSYMSYVATPPSVWERLSWWFQSMLQRIFLNPNTPWLTQIAYYLIVVAVLGLATFYIIRLRYGGGMTADYQSFTSVTGMDTSNVEDFDNLLTNALEQQNYKLAIRYIYLRSLASLARRDMIMLKDWKSPYDYSQELQGDIASTYMEMARLFEFVWYGDFAAGKKEYDEGAILCAKLENA